MIFPRHGILFLLFAALFFSGCEEEAPRIDSVYPPIGRMGKVLTIRGEHFGDEQDESYVTVAGIAPTSSSYILWQDDAISFTVPEFGESGLVYVHRGNRKSNAALFANEDAVPVPVTGPQAETGPRIVSIEPRSAAIGSAVTIRGNNFGAFREGGAVFFAWAAEQSPSAPAELSGPLSVPVSESDLGYEAWGERELRVRVPDGAVSGNLEVRTGRGSSQGEYFEVTEKPGSKVYRDKRSYAISYAADIRVTDASAPNTLYIVMPRPVSSASQRLGELISRKNDPFIENYRGVSLYKLNDLASNTGAEIAVSYLVEVYAVETSVNASRIRSGRASALETAYTRHSPLVPSDNPLITRQASAIIGREQNPYQKARLIYNWLLKETDIRTESRQDDVLTALVQKQADPYHAALLFCALSRAAGVAALPQAGVLVDSSRATIPHYWAEFWIEGFGWIPADPALGAGAAPAAFNLRPDAASYYFGSLDNQRICFSRGETTLPQMESQGRVTARSRGYALQNIWEEAAGGLISYSSLWGDITINGVYVQ
ncbi:MAG: IPT/TIG domain-containing protein [Spirochaetaceae bacterium]|jgi:transglutaminase-like putative cysteine protease|nr:IPT/TIG domain-containing protein [Spirochaetaceae bacterium]